MPILLRLILGRIFLLGTSVLTFLGVSPEVAVLTPDEAEVKTEERKEVVRETVGQDKDSNPPDVVFVEIDKTPTESPSIIIPEIIKIVAPEIIPEEITAEDVTEIIEEIEIRELAGVENTVVNIVCVNRQGTRINVSTGSGVIISPNGVVITNAHVAQSFLLENYTREKYMDCSLRKENIPTYGFTAKLLYLPTDWIEDNFHLINTTGARGTGADDYAFLYITGNTNPTLRKPATLQFSPLNTREEAVDVGSRVSAVGYPGIKTGVFDINGISKLASDIVRITDVFTFNTSNIDVISTSNTPVAKRGSSGGGLFQDGSLVGLIVTTSPGVNQINASINAITSAYIDRDFRQDTGRSISNFLNRNLEAEVTSFNENVAPSLLRILEQGL